MSDIIDDAQDHIEKQMVVAMQAALENSKPKFKPTGFCYFCEEKIGTGKIYCDEHCAEDHEYQIKRQKQNVRVL